MAFRLPTTKERVLVLGSTGSGKTQMGAWLLSHAPFHIIPYVIVDYKRDDLLASLDRAKQIGLNDVPDEPGLYHIKPNPVSDDDAVDAWLMRLWRKRNIGLYIDEALRIPTKKSGAFETILTQGRSLHIPTIALSQRPVDLTRYAFSEANHVVSFRLTDRRDRKTVSEYIPLEHDAPRLPEFHSRWYDVGGDRFYQLAPVPDRDIIIERIQARLEPRRRVI